MERSVQLLPFAPAAADEDEEEAMAPRHFRRIDTADSLASEMEPMVVENSTSTTSNPPLLGREESAWLVERDLDAMFTRVYDYYRERGMGSIIASRMAELVTMAFTIATSTFLLALVDWHHLNECRDESSCLPLVNYTRSFNDVESGFGHLVLVGCALFSVRWAVLLVQLPGAVRRAISTRQFYRDRLNITTRELQTMEWSTVVSRLASLQQRSKFQINDAPLTGFHVALRVMRKENYLIAMINKGLLPLGSPDWRTMVPLAGWWSRSAPWWMGQTLEWNVYHAILDHLIDPHTFEINKNLSGDSLRARLKFFAVTNLLLMPFILAFSAVHFFLRYAEEFHSRRNYLGPRSWTPHALWRMREFNELPHYFDRRVHGSTRASERFLRLFPNPVPVVLARAAAFLTGGVVATLLVMGLYEESILLHVRAGDRNLLWWGAIFSTLLALARSFVPAPEDENVVFSPDAQMRRVAAYTHLLPESWRHRAYTYEVRDEFSSLFPFRAVLLVRELLCVLWTPYILGMVLTRHAEDIAKFVHKFTTNVDGVGDVCTFSLMRLEQNGDPVWMNLTQLTQPPSEVDVVCDGKLEKSWLGFKLQYTVSDCGLRDDVGESLIRKVADFQKAHAHAVDVPAEFATGTGGGKPLRVALDWEWSGPGPGASSSAATVEELHSALGVPSVVAATQRGSRSMVNRAGEDFFWWLEEWRDAEDAQLGAGGV